MCKFPGIAPADIYLPSKEVDPSKWAVVACDQYTSQPDYWEKADAIAGGSPSALRIIMPEIYLSDAESRIPKIRAAMEKYLSEGSLIRRVENGFVLTERTTESGARLGLIAKLDLEKYDYRPGEKPLVRATEGTITERIPPRVKIREGAKLESPHVMVLIDDPASTVVEAAHARVKNDAPLYDFDVMLGGGHLRGWAIEDEARMQALSDALWALDAQADGFLFAVGDGNHSLATAKACWESLKGGLSDAERENHPARYALCEIVNLHSPALLFEPIHRVLFGAGMQALIDGFSAFLSEKGLQLTEGNDIVFVADGAARGFSVKGAEEQLPVAVLQPYLDAFLLENKAVSIDYIHGDEAVRALSKGGNTGILLGAIDKGLLFPSIRSGGVLPRKTFSMGEAHEKRYYMECRKIL